MIAPADIGVHRAGGNLGQQIRRRARAMHPAEEARIGIARAIGQQRFHPAHHVRHAPALAGQRRLQRVLDLARQLGPHAALTGVLQPVDGGIQHMVGLRAELVPVFRVEGFLRGRLFDGLVSHARVITRF